MQEISISFKPTPLSTKVFIGKDILWGADFLKNLPQRTVIISDDRVGPHLGLNLEKHLHSRGFSATLLTFPSGEQNKTRSTKEALEDQMQDLRLDRESGVIGLGGGVTTDLSGFIASTYYRGIPLILVPTSLLAMVDASLGGKTGVNTQRGKNLIGTFYPAQSVWIDSATLSSLAVKERLNGLAEIIKYALISSDEFFERIDKHIEDWNRQNETFLLEMIRNSCQIKKHIVEKDFKEMGLRRILNFGHTIGHALESLENYQISHGEAIAIGMIAEAYLSMRLKHLQIEDFEKIHSLFQKYRFPLKISQSFSSAKWMEALSLDKKRANEQVRFVLLNAIGKTVSFEGKYCCEIDFSLVQETIEWINKQFFYE